MSRVLFPYLLALLLLAPCARAGEPEPPQSTIGPAEVGRLLISEDDQERARGLALLTNRIQRGGPGLPAFLAAMAAEQAGWANAEERLVALWVGQALRGAPAEKERARRLLAALGPEATRLLLHAIREAEAVEPAAIAKEVPPPPAAALPPPPRTPQAPLPPPPPRQPLREWVLEREVLLLPRAEIARWTEDGHEAFAPALSGQAVVFEDGKDRALVASLRLLPDAVGYLIRASKDINVFGDGTVRVAEKDALVLLQGGRYRYRRNVRRTGKGGWAVDTDTVPRGLHVRLETEPTEGGRVRFVVEARNVELPTPMATVEQRPAPDVEPLELDVPEWQVSSMRASFDADPDAVAVLALFPEIVEGKVVAVSIRTAQDLPEVAAREVAK